MGGIILSRQPIVGINNVQVDFRERRRRSPDLILSSLLYLSGGLYVVDAGSHSPHPTDRAQRHFRIRCLPVSSGRIPCVLELTFRKHPV